MKNILFAISSLGLGHATRTLPIIKDYLRDNNIHLISTGNALKFLSKELEGYNVIFFDYKDYPNIERGKGLAFYFYLLGDLLKTIFVIKSEDLFTRKIIKKHNIDFIISDGRYRVCSKKIPSFLITHQISYIMPKGLKPFQKPTDYFNRRIFKKFKHIFILDYKDEKNNLAGFLSHDKILKKINHKYVGILSSYNSTPITKEKDIDYLFVISGFLLEYKDSFVSKLIKEAEDIKGKKVFVLGDTSKEEHIIDQKNNIEIYSYVSGKKREEIMSRSKTIISRAGYTTIMDLVELEKKALLIPTPGQTEQEYLSKYVETKKYFKSGVTQFDFDLKNMLENIDETKLFIPPWKTKETIKKIKKILNQYIK